MKKKILAVAIAGAFAAPAIAQVTVYGTIDASVTSVNKVGTTSVSQTNVGSSAWTTNRIGFRGTEDLGGGLKGSFGLESRFNTDSGTAFNTGTSSSNQFSLGGRGVFVGVEGGFGSIKVGGDMSTLGDAAVTGPFGNFTNLGLLAPVAGGRPDNAIIYETPTFNGVKAQFALGRGESATSGTTKNDNYQSFGVTGKIGGFSFIAMQAVGKSQAVAGTAQRCVVFASNAQGSINAGQNATVMGTGPTSGSCDTSRTGTDVFAGNSTAGSDVGAVIRGIVGGSNTNLVTITPGLLATGATDFKTKDTGLTIGYDFGMAQVTYQTLKTKSSGNMGTGTTSSATAQLVQHVDRRSQGLTVTAPMGNITPFVFYQEYEQKAGTGAQNGAMDVDMMAIGVNYALSKRTDRKSVV